VVGSAARGVDVILVDTGAAYAIEPPASQERPFAELLAAATGVASADQVLLSSEGGKVEESALLQPGAEPLVLFKRSTLGSGGTPEPVAYDLDEIAAPESTSVTYTSSATSDPAMAVIQTYERTFCLHVDQARAYLEGCRRRHEFVLDNLSCARNQLYGMRVASANLKSHSAQIKEAMSSFLGKFEEDCSKHRLLLERVDGHLASLAAIELDAGVRKDIPHNPTTLLQCCEPEEQLRSHATECAAFIDSLEAKVSLVPAVLAKLDREVGKILAGASVSEEDGSAVSDADDAPPSTVMTSQGSVWVSGQDPEGEGLAQWLGALEQCGKHSAPNLSRLEEIAAEFDAHHAEIVQLMGNDAKRSGEDNDSPLGGASAHFAMFDERHKHHERELLPEARQLAEAVGGQVSASCEARTLVGRFVSGQLHRVSAMQYAIVQQVRNKLELFQSGLARQTRAMEVFEHLFRAPPAYEGFLLEKRRREEYSRTVAAAASAFAQTLDKYRQEELGLREEFFAEHGRHLPRPFLEIPVMEGQPGVVEVQAPPPLPDSLLVSTDTSSTEPEPEPEPEPESPAKEAPTVASLLASVTELELENGRLRSAATAGEPRHAEASEEDSMGAETERQDCLETAPSIENSTELARRAEGEESVQWLSQCWAAAAGPAEGLDDSSLAASEAAERPDAAAVVERVGGMRVALTEAQRRVAEQEGELGDLRTTQAELMRELERLREKDGKYRSFVSAVLRAEQAAAQALAERGLAPANAASLVASGAGGRLSPRSPSPVNLPPQASTRQAGNPSPAPRIGRQSPQPRESDDAELSGLVEDQARPSSPTAAAGASSRRGSGDWLGTLGETVCAALRENVSLRLDAAAQDGTEGAEGRGLGADDSVGSAPPLPSEGVLAYDKVDVDDVVLFCPVALPTGESGEGGSEQLPECVWQALLSDSCGDGMPHFLNTESLDPASLGYGFDAALSATPRAGGGASSAASLSPRPAIDAFVEQHTGEIEPAEEPAKPVAGLSVGEVMRTVGRTEQWRRLLCCAVVVHIEDCVSDGGDSSCGVPAGQSYRLLTVMPE